MTGKFGILYFRNRSLPEPEECLVHLELNDFIVHSLYGDEDGSILPRITGEIHIIMADFPFRNPMISKVIHNLRAHHAVPLVFLLSNFKESVQVDAFTEGADDIADRTLPPEKTTSLITRMKNLIALSEGKGRDGERIWRAGPHLVSRSTSKRQITVDGERVHLTPTEWNILLLLCEKNGQVVPREIILASCFDYQYEGYDRSIDAHVKNLRKKVPRTVETVRGVGYRFVGRNISDREAPYPIERS